MYDRATLKERAKAVLAEYRGPSIGVLVLYSILVAVLTGVSLGLGAIFLAPPLAIGLYLFFIRVWRRESPAFETLFDGFQRYTQSLVGILWMDLWIFLWSLLFVVPGIIKSLSYSMTPYLIADHPNLNAQKALRISMAITDGHKGEIFMLHLSFIGWHILSAFTLGILEIVYVGPYLQTALAGMYAQILREALEEGIVSEADMES